MIACSEFDVTGTDASSTRSTSEILQCATGPWQGDEGDDLVRVSSVTRQNGLLEIVASVLKIGSWTLL